MKLGERIQFFQIFIQEAKSSIKRSLEQWMPSYQAVLENKQEAGQFDPVEVCPLLYTTRISSAKILIELELFDEATQVSYHSLQLVWPVPYFYQYLAACFALCLAFVA